MEETTGKLNNVGKTKIARRKWLKQVQNLIFVQKLLSWNPRQFKFNTNAIPIDHNLKLVIKVFPSYQAASHLIQGHPTRI